MLNSCKVRRNTRTREIDQVVIDRPFTDERANVIYNYYRSVGIPIQLGKQAMQQELLRRGYNLDFQIIGEQGVANLENNVEILSMLDLASEMFDEGKTNDEIWLATGWYREDGRWKTEVEYGELNPILTEEILSQPLLTVNLGGLYNGKVMELYPELQEIEVIFQPLEGGMLGGTYGNQIVIDSTLSRAEKKKVLIHEVQHIIQRLEGFLTGANPNVIEQELSYRFEQVNKKTPNETEQNKIREIANNLYTRWAGEVEARNASQRAELSSVQRREYSPEITGDTPPIFSIEKGDQFFKSLVDDSHLQFLSTPSGEVYGFVTPEGEMFLDPDIAGVNTLIHEGAHIQYKVLKTAAERGDVKAQAILNKIQELTAPAVETIFNAKKAQERSSDSMPSVDMQAEQIITKKMPELTELADKNIQIIKDYDRYQRILQKQAEGRRVLKTDLAFLDSHPELKNPPILDFGTPSDILRSVGITNSIKISMSHINRKLVGKEAHELTLLDLQDLMRAIHNPATVNKGAKGRVQLLTNHTNSNGAPIVVVLDNNFKTNIASITTAYALNNLTKVVPETSQDVLYTNNKRLADFLSDYSESKNRGFGIALFSYPEYDSSTGTIKYTQEKTNPEIEFDTTNIRKIIENTKNIINKTNVSGVDFQIIGEQGAQRIQEYADSLSKAKELEQEGIPYDQIEIQTGWYKYEGQWRTIPSEVLQNFKIEKYETNTILPLREVLVDENPLFEFYPELQEISVVFVEEGKPDTPQNLPKGFENSEGLYEEATKTIFLSTMVRDKRQTDTGLEYNLGHEVQHVISEIEGFPKGGDRTSVVFEAAELSSPAYNQRENETDEQYKERLREEMFARALGDNAEQYLKDLGFTAQEAKTFLQKVQEFLAEIVDWLRGKKGLQDLSVDEINKLSIREFLDRSTTSMMLGEFKATPQTAVQESATEQELEQIKAQAIANGTFMKAPNGRDTNLNERQWLQVRSKAFIDWFGDWLNDPENASKVVDENGEPMVVYHGTNAEFDVFETRVGIRGNQYTGAIEVESEVFFFTADKEFAMKAAHARKENFGGKSNIKEVFLNIRKPLDFSEYRYETEEIFKDFVGKYPHEHFGDIENLDQWWTLFDNDEDDITSKVKEEGYEGVILAETTKEVRIDDNYSETVADIKSFGVFHPNQIKSATDNVGTFSSESNNINFQITEEQGSRNLDQESKAFNEGVEAVAKLANEYKKEFGIDSVRHNKVGKLFPAVSRMISEAYEQAETGMTSEEVREAYKALEEETLQQYKFIVDKGLKVSRWTGEGEPYPNSKSMLKDVRENNHLYFLPNSEAFGKEGDEVEGRAGLKLTDVYLDDGYRMTLSEVFRVVHDYFGHGILGNQFGAVGEENATLQHLDLYSFKALPAVIFQTRGQNSWVNFSGVNDEALRKIREGSRTNNKNLLEEGQKELRFATPKDNILPKIFNFKTYETARRINEQEEIRKSEAYLDPRGTHEDTYISELLTRLTSRNSGKLNGFSRRSLGVSKRLGGYDVDVIAEYEGNQEVESLIKKVFPQFKGTQKIYEISNGDVYRELMIEALETNKFKSSVTVHSAEDFSNMRLFVTEDGSTGITLTKDGFLGGAFGNPKANRPNNLAQLMLLGIKEGAITAEAFATILPDYYSMFGFKAVSRTAFNDEYRPLKENGALEDWDYELYSKFNNGRPDVVFFIYDGGDRESIQNRIGQFDDYKNYQKQFTEYYDKDSYDDAYRFMEIEAINKGNYQNQEVNSQITETQGAQTISNVESTAKALEGVDIPVNTPIKGLSVRMTDLKIAEENLAKGKKSVTPNAPVDVTINLTTGERELSDGYHRYLDARGGTIEAAKITNLDGTIPAKINFEINEKSGGFIKPRKATNQEISEAYHKAKADGSNPELVKTVEELLGESDIQGVQVLEYQGSTLSYKQRVNPITNQPTNQIEIDLISVPQENRNQGHARELLRRITEIADSRGQELYLFAAPRDRTTTTEGLIKLYKEFGFESISSFLPEEMVRPSRRGSQRAEESLTPVEPLLTEDLNGVQEYVPADKIITYYTETGEINYKRNSEGDLVMLKTVSATPQQEESIAYQQLLSIPNISKEQALEAYKNLYSTEFYDWKNKTNEC